MKAQLEATINPRDVTARSETAQEIGRMVAASTRTWARIAGILYLVNIIGGLFAVGYVPAALVVSFDAAATAHNILSHELLYRLSIVVHSIALLCNIPLAVIFYDLFKVVNKKLSLMVVCFLVVGSAFEATNLLNQFTPLLLLDGGHSVTGLTTDQLQTQVATPLQLQAIGYSLGQVFYVGYLLLTSYLIFRSTFLPRAVGVLLAIGGGCYLFYSFSDFLAPVFAAHLVPAIQLPSGLGELSLCLWLLVMGVNAERWAKKRASTISEPHRA